MKLWYLNHDDWIALEVTHPNAHAFLKQRALNGEYRQLLEREQRGTISEPERMCLAIVMRTLGIKDHAQDD